MRTDSPKKQQKKTIREHMLRKNPEQTIWEQLLRQPKTQTKRYENRCSEITQKKTKWEQMLRKKKMIAGTPARNQRKWYKHVSKKTGTPNKNSSWTLWKLPVWEQGLMQKEAKTHRNRWQFPVLVHLHALAKWKKDVSVNVYYRLVA